MTQQDNIRPIWIEGITLDDTYFKLLSSLYDNGREYKITSGSFAGSSRLEFDYVAGVIHQPHIRPLAPIMPEGIPIPTTDEDIDNYFVNYIMDPDLKPNEEYRYSSWINGKILSNKEDVPPNPIGLISYINHYTPVEWVIKHFKEKGYGNNHCYITIGDPNMLNNYDIPYEDETERRTTPCLRGIDFKIKGGQLIISVTFRSWDLYGGFPENMGGFILLNEYVANELGDVKPGPICFNSSGAHCYDFQLDVLKARLGKE